MRDGEVGMSLTICDRCCARAVTWWAWVDDDTDRDLLFCSHHSDAHADAMVGAGWGLIADEREPEGVSQ